MGAAARRVSIAVGMITAPFFWDRRGQVRSTMMQYPPVLAGRMAFRFVVGNYMPSLQWDAAVRSKVAALDEEIKEHADIVRVDGIDGPNLDNGCSCIEKQAAWVQFALRAWPYAAFIAKTEDDTYVQLHVLEGELMALREHRNVRHGHTPPPCDHARLAPQPSPYTPHATRYPTRTHPLPIRCSTATIRSLSCPSGRRRVPKSSRQAHASRVRPTAGSTSPPPHAPPHALHTHRTCTEHAPHVAGRASPRRTALPPRSLVLALARGGSDIPDPAWHRRHEARESQRVEDAFLLVPQLAALASRGGLSRRMAALRTGDEPLSR